MAELLEFIKSHGTYDSQTQKYTFNSDSINKLVTEEPKKAKNPFLLFKEQNMDNIKKYIEDCAEFSGQGSFSKAAGDLWKNMSLEDKLPYEKEHSKLKLKQIESKKNYDNTFGRFNLSRPNVVTSKKRGRPRKVPLPEDIDNNNGYKSLILDGVKYELEIETNVLWDENRDETVGQKVGPKKYDFY